MRGPPTPPPPPSAPVEPTEVVPADVMDLQTALAAVGHSRALLLPMIRHIRQLDVGPLVAAAEAGDLGRVRRLAHRMGGEASYIYARAFSAACRELSTFQGDAVAARPLVQAVVDQHEALARALARIEEAWG